MSTPHKRIILSITDSDTGVSHRSSVSLPLTSWATALNQRGVFLAAADEAALALADKLFGTMVAVPPPPSARTTWKPHRSNQMLTTHSIERCAGSHCCVHNPSDHHMKDWPQHYRSDTGITERICPHGVGHPDPDCAVAQRSIDGHGCDGCCRAPANDQPSLGPDGRPITNV